MLAITVSNWATQDRLNESCYNEVFPGVAANNPA